MIILVTGGSLLALAFGLAIATDIRDRKSRHRAVPDGRIDARKADSFTVPTNFFGMGGAGEYFPPPDDGRPSH